jgi:S-adenosylmethionine/arginine decarboxylase-like enzyme
MHKAIQHKHIIIRAECNDPPMNPIQAVAWWEKLVRDIGMTKLPVEGNPICGYVDTPGNAGLTIAGIIETSHIAMHVWDELDPALIQLDVYTCSSLDTDIVIKALQQFSPISIEHKYFDREYKLLEQS